jgi:TonB dependent receptor/TonB-dependent Receptor Plug Domain
MENPSLLFVILQFHLKQQIRKNKMKSFGIVFFIAFTAYADIKGVLFEKGKKIPVKNTQVYLPSENLQATTNEAGEFVFPTNSTTVEIKINASLYLPVTMNIQADQLNKIYLERKAAKSTLNLNVEDSNYKKDQSMKSLNRQQIFDMPGANGDPIKALQNLPGINRTQGFSSQVVIQGAAPKDTSYDFEGHEIPIVFHFGGLSSVVMPEAVEKVDYYSAGYQVERSRALGGVISLSTRDPDVADRSRKGLFYLDNLSAGGLMESKIDDQSSFLISGRYSYVGFFLKTALKDNESLNLTVAPEFYDITAIYSYKIAENEKFKISYINSNDRLGFVFKEPLKQDPSIRGEFSNTISFYRFIPSWQKQFNENSRLKLSLGYGTDQIAANFSDKYFKISNDSLTTRALWEYRLTSDLSLNSGWDNIYSKSRVKIKLPLVSSQGGISNPFSSGEVRETDIISKSNNVGLFSEFVYQWTPDFKIIPGVRFDSFSTTKESFLTPRLASQYKYDELLSFKFGSGLYVQNPEPQESSEDFGNPDINSPKAAHFSLGFDRSFKNEKLQLFSMNAFYKNYYDLVQSSSNKVLRNGIEVFEVYNNQGSGYSFGLENQIKYQFEDVELTASYTWSKSMRKAPNNKEYNFEYDQTHNLNLISSYQLNNNWKVSSRYRYVTGNPFTPVTGSVYDSDNETYFPLRGEIYSERNNPFSQLDLRVDKKIITDEQIWTFYLDIQNILNIKNSEGYRYSYDYTEKKDITGIPVLPSLGVKGEF